MGDTNQKELIILIKSVLDEQGYTKLHEENEKLVEGADNSKKSTNEQAEAFDGLKDKLTEMATAYVGVEIGLKAVHAAWDYAKESFSEAANAQQQFYALSQTLKLLANATDEDTIAAKEWIEQLEKASGVGKDQLIPTFDKLVAATKDVKVAQDLMAIAAGASARNIGDLQSNADLLIRQYQNPDSEIPKRNTSAFASALRDAKKEAGNLQGALGSLAGKYGDAGQDVKTVNQEIARNEIAWKNTKEAVGNLALELVSVFRPALHAVAYGATQVGEGIYKLGMAAKALSAIAKGNFWELGMIEDEMKAKVAATDKEFTDAWKTTAEGVKTSTSQTTADMTAAAGKIAESHKKIVKGYNDQLAAAKLAHQGISGILQAMTKDENLSVEERAKAQKQLDEQGKKGTRDRLKEEKDAMAEEVKNRDQAYHLLLNKAKEAGKSEIASWMDEAEVYRRMAHDRNLTDVQRSDAHDKAVALDKKVDDAYGKSQEDGLKKEKQLADNRERIADIELERKQVRVKKDLKQDLADAQAEKKLLEDKLLNVKKETEEEIKIREKLLAAEKRIAVAEGKIVEEEKKQIKSKLALMGQAANAGVELMGAAFGKNKEMQLAQAIINGISAAVESFTNAGGYPAGIIPMAISIATTAAQVAEIENTHPAGGDVTTGTGFDDPQNDLMMRTAFKRWAQDASREMLGGLGEGLGKGRQMVNNDYSTHINNPGQTQNIKNFNVHADMIIDTDRQLRELDQKLDVAHSLNQEGNVK